MHVTLRREELERLRLLRPNARWDEIEQEARRNIGVLPWVWGLYSSTTHTVYILPKAIEVCFWLIGYLPAAKLKALKLTLVHGVAHAMDEELYGSFTCTDIATEEALEAFTAVREGHAEFVMRKAAERCGDWSIAEDWIGSYERRNEPDVVFRYARGREFIEALAERGALSMRHVYARPPVRLSQILDPTTYP